MPGEPASIPTSGGGDPLVGRELGDFVVRRRIGEGGFGAIYLAEQPALDRTAVIKVVHERHRERREVVDRFLGEARLASRLDHPYAAHLYAFGAEPDGLLWIAMEHVRGTPLDAMIAGAGPLALPRLVPLFERIAEVVGAAHELGIVHRDLKPANVMVIVRAGKLLPKLLDFGIASLALEAQRGSELILGSPLYMAPEQWIDGPVDARADIYALGALAFEALTGAPPFRGKGILALARKHARAPVPPLGDAFPPALHQAIARAMAKRADDRFDHAVELAAALRRGAGLAERPAPLPALPDDVRAMWRHRGPRPIAEAVDVCDAATNAHQARDALWRLVGQLVQYAGIVAMACHSKQASPASPAAAELLRRLRHSGLGDHEWFELARELTRADREQPGLHPVPELVELLHGEAAPARAGSEAMSTLLGLRPRADDPTTEQGVRDHLVRAVACLADGLAALAFLCDYPLLACRGDRGQRWMGSRRTGRATVVIQGAPLADDTVVLASAEGVPVAVMSPLAQVRAPVPGAELELFLLERDGRAGARLVSFPLGFVHDDPELWSWYREALFDSEASAGEAGAAGVAPYRGLSAYTADHADDFYGREREIEAVVNRLQRQPLLAVVGPSGVGKSSFVQAGVLAELAPARACVMRPGAQPFATLAARLAVDLDLAEVDAAALRADVTLLGQRLRAGAGLTVLVVDQFEEIFTLCSDADERRDFAAALVGAARTADESVRVILTLRDDFLLRAQALEPLRDRLDPAIQLLGTPSAVDLLRIVREPARRAGCEFDDPTLPGEMVREVAGAPGALALLSFSAARLWELRDRHFRRLTRAAYEQMSGVGGALARHADATLAEMSAEKRRLVREAFRRLVTADGTRAVVELEALVAAMGDEARAHAVVERLVGARLLVASESETGAQRIEIIHEALLEAWPRLVTWRRRDAEGARLRDQLREASTQWDQRGRPQGLLWRDDALTELRVWRGRYRGGLTPVEDAFASASVRAAARGRRRRRQLVALAFSVLAAGLVVLLLLNMRANQERGRARSAAADARARLAEFYLGEGRQLALGEQPMRALLFLREARRQGNEHPELAYLLGRTVRSLRAQERNLTEHTGMVFNAGFTPDGARLITSDEDSARLWDVASGRELRRFGGHAREGVWSISLSPDGRELVTTGWDGAVLAFDVETGALRQRYQGHDGAVWHAVHGPGGELVATSSSDHTVRVWRAGSAEPLLTLEREPADVVLGPETQASAVAFAPDGRWLVAGGGHGVSTVWNLPDGAVRYRLGGHSEPVLSVAVSGDGTRIATVSADATSRLWNATTGQLVAVLPHGGWVVGAAFSPDGALLATAAYDQKVRLWRADSGRLVAQLEGHTGQVMSVGFCRDGSRLLSTSTDRSVRVWSRDGLPVTTLLGHDNMVPRAGFDPGCERIASASYDGTAKVWRSSSPQLAASAELGDTIAWLRPTAGGVVAGTADGRVVSLGAGAEPTVLARAHGAAATAMGRDLVAIADGSRVRLRRVGADEETVIDAGDVVSTLAVSADDRAVAIGTAGGALRLWDVAAATQMAAVEAHAPAAVSSIEFAADGRVISAGGNTARVWSARGAALATLRGHLAPVLHASFGPGDVVVTASGDATARTWDLATGAQLATMQGHRAGVHCAQFDPSGELVATAAGDGTVRVWSADGTPLSSQQAHGGDEDGVNWVTSVGFSPDGERVWSGGYDGRVKSWSAAPNHWTVAELDALSRCVVPLALSHQSVVAAATDPTACARVPALAAPDNQSSF